MQGKHHSGALWLGVGLALASCQSGGGSPGYRCQGNEPFWNLEIAGDRATYRSLSEPDPRSFTGGLRVGRERGRAVIEWRGAEVGTAELDLVASITEETCLDTMADETPPLSHRVRVALPEGQVVAGCCHLRPLPRGR